VALPLGSILFVSLPFGLLGGRLSRHGLALRQLDRTVDILTRGRVHRADPLDGLERAGRREERWAVCLATDLADYVRLTERMLLRGPALADLLATYREILHEVVERHGGTVLDFVGDASMCVWEADAPSAAIRVRAVRAALELAERLDRFAAACALEGQRTRIGLAEGMIVLGNLDTGDHFAFGGVGEPLNTASRLEQLNKRLGTRVLATAAVVRDLEGLPTCQIGPVSLKGKVQPEEVVALEPAA
jgi:adenylate cyclase